MKYILILIIVGGFDPSTSVGDSAKQPFEVVSMSGEHDKSDAKPVIVRSVHQDEALTALHLDAISEVLTVGWL